MKAVVAAFNQEIALVGAFSVIVNPHVDHHIQLYQILALYNIFHHVTLTAAHPGDAGPDPGGAGAVPAHRPHRRGARHLDRPRPLLLAPHLQPLQEIRGLEIPLLHVSRVVSV